MPPNDRELGAITQRLTDIERRLAEGEDDMRTLVKTMSELSAAIAGLTARIAMLPTSPDTAHEERTLALFERIADRLSAPSPASAAPHPITTPAAAGGGAIFGAVLWQKIAAWLGIG